MRGKKTRTPAGRTNADAQRVRKMSQEKKKLVSNLGKYWQVPGQSSQEGGLSFPSRGKRVSKPVERFQVGQSEGDSAKRRRTYPRNSTRPASAGTTLAQVKEELEDDDQLHVGDEQAVVGSVSVTEPVTRPCIVLLTRIKEDTDPDAGQLTDGDDLEAGAANCGTTPVDATPSNATSEESEQQPQDSELLSEDEIQIISETVITDGCRQYTIDYGRPPTNYVGTPMSRRFQKELIADIDQEAGASSSETAAIVPLRKTVTLTNIKDDSAEENASDSDDEGSSVTLRSETGSVEEEEEEEPQIRISTNIFDEDQDEDDDEILCLN